MCAPWSTDAITAAVALLKGETPAATGTYNNGKIDVPAKQSAVVTVDKDNVQSALIDSGYYNATDFTGLPLNLSEDYNIQG